MPIGNDPFAAFEGAIEFLVAIGAIWGVGLVVIGRRGARKRRRYRSFSNLGSAFQELQKVARPSIEYQLKEQSRVNMDEDDEGGPDDPGRYYRRLRERIDRLHAEDPNNEDQKNKAD